MTSCELARLNELIDKKDGQTSNLSKEEQKECEALLEMYADENVTEWIYSPHN